MKITFEKLRSK